MQKEIARRRKEFRHERGGQILLTRQPAAVEKGGQGGQLELGQAGQSADGG
jgi:hypothetical protein